MTATTEDDPDFKKILSYVFKVKGFDGQSYKRNYIKRRIAVRMRATETTSYHDYFHLLQENPQEPSLLLDRLTIHVTEFFRDPEVYQAIQDKFLMDAAALPGKKMRVWCTACSTGEEPYSVAILLKEWEYYHPGFSFEILASDIDTPSVQCAELGDYSPDSVKKMSKIRTLRWFRREEPKVKVSQELRKSVHFRVHDLLGKWSPGMSGFHLIFCRNLLIYLKASQQQWLYGRFAEALIPGGYLVLGLTETLMGAARRLYRCVDIRHRIYQTLTEAGDSPPNQAFSG
jgi:chemotaxis protein methyltransferase CheR